LSRLKVRYLGVLHGLADLPADELGDEGVGLEAGGEVAEAAPQVLEDLVALGVADLEAAALDRRVGEPAADARVFAKISP
jgi:hypothetical protein